VNSVPGLCSEAVQNGAGARSLDARGTFEQRGPEKGKRIMNSSKENGENEFFDLRTGLALFAFEMLRSRRMGLKWDG
jgi:hypothetical protein